MYQLAGWGQETDLTELLVGRQDQRNKNGITLPEEELERMKLHPWRQFWGGDLLGGPPWRTVTQAHTGHGEGGGQF